VTRIVALFDSPEKLARAAAASERAGWRTASLCSPAFDERLLQIAGATRSPVAIWGFWGGAIGVVSGLLLTIGTVRQWPGLIVSGKPLVAMPAFLIIAFELGILGASIAAIVSFLLASKRARRRAGAICEPSTTDARFSLLVEAPAGQHDMDALLQSAGAIEWRTV
jgi:Protein of unknown function (DUF3341)